VISRRNGERWQVSDNGCNVVCVEDMYIYTVYTMYAIYARGEPLCLTMCELTRAGCFQQCFFFPSFFFFFSFLFPSPLFFLSFFFSFPFLFFFFFLSFFLFNRSASLCRVCFWWMNRGRGGAGRGVGGWVDGWISRGQCPGRSPGAGAR